MNELSDRFRIIEVPRNVQKIVTSYKCTVIKKTVQIFKCYLCREYQKNLTTVPITDVSLRSHNRGFCSFFTTLALSSSHFNYKNQKIFTTVPIINVLLSSDNRGFSATSENRNVIQTQVDFKSCADFQDFSKRFNNCSHN